MKFYTLDVSNGLFDEQPVSEISDKEFIQEAELNGQVFTPHEFENFYNESLSVSEEYLRISFK